MELCSESKRQVGSSYDNEWEQLATRWKVEDEVDMGHAPHVSRRCLPAVTILQIYYHWSTNPVQLTTIVTYWTAYNAPRVLLPAGVHTLTSREQEGTARGPTESNGRAPAVRCPPARVAVARSSTAHSNNKNNTVVPHAQLNIVQQ